MVSLLGVRVKLLFNRLLKLVNPNDEVLIFIRRGIGVDVNLLTVLALFPLSVVFVVGVLVVRGSDKLTSSADRAGIFSV